MKTTIILETSLIKAYIMQKDTSLYSYIHSSNNNNNYKNILDFE